ncbi:hypothetical protein KP509_26G059500 [Ceratopteris richardii]|nr:hypothetical protein KP509_26G059500 [Ceratopteris richardii]
MRYGKYCGLGYTGCPGEAPCDGLDACCLAHDVCIGSSWENLLNKKCNWELLHCVRAYRKSRANQFPGNTCDIRDVEFNIETAMRIALNL